MTSSTPKYNILIAEDDPSIQKLYHRLLSPLADITMVDNGKKAQELLTNSIHFNLILTDNTMPLLTGLELLASLPNTITTPRLMISSTFDPHGIHQEVKQHGGLGLYQKPLPCINQFRTITSELLTLGHSPTLHTYFEQKYN